MLAMDILSNSSKYNFGVRPGLFLGDVSPVFEIFVNVFFEILSALAATSVGVPSNSSGCFLLVFMKCSTFTISLRDWLVKPHVFTMCGDL